MASKRRFHWLRSKRWYRLWPDATEHIQAALNYVSSLKPDQNGVRGAVLLEPGRYEVGTTLWINASGVVLRGSGYGPGGTEIIANYRDRTTLIRFKGVDNRSTGTCYTIADESLPVGTTQIVLPGHRLKAGDHIRISLRSQLSTGSSPDKMPPDKKQPCPYEEYALDAMGKRNHFRRRR